MVAVLLLINPCICGFSPKCRSLLPTSSGARVLTCGPLLGPNLWLYCLVADWIHFTVFGIILPTIKLEAYTFWGLWTQQLRLGGVMQVYGFAKTARGWDGYTCLNIGACMMVWGPRRRTRIDSIFRYDRKATPNVYSLHCSSCLGLPYRIIDI